MKKYGYLVLVLFALIISGCFFPTRTTRVIGSGELATESRNVSNFSAVELSGVGTLIIEQGDQESLAITAEENLIEYLRSDVQGKNLRLGVREFVSIDPRESIIYRLTVKNLEKLETSGLGNVEISELTTQIMDLEISGSGNVDIDDLQAESFSLQVSGLGNIDISGKVASQRVDLSGAGNYNAEELFSQEAKIRISGTGRAIVWAEEQLDVEISGMGSLNYYGSPALNTEMSGAGSIKSLGKK